METPEVDLCQFVALNRGLESEWFSSYGDPDIDFIYDGATDPSLWIESPWRIMCLLKEAHGGGQWNHADGIQRDNGLLRVGGTANQAVHYRMIEWLHAIECELSRVDANIEGDRSEGYPEARKTMLRSAWVNIKKANGVAYSNNGNLSQVVERDSHFLKRQIDLLNPKLILCGYTFEISKDELFSGCKHIDGTKFSYQHGNGRVIMDYWHPGRKARNSYEALVEEVQKIRGAGFLV